MTDDPQRDADRLYTERLRAAGVLTWGEVLGQVSLRVELDGVIERHRPPELVRGSSGDGSVEAEVVEGYLHPVLGFVQLLPPARIEFVDERPEVFEQGEWFEGWRRITREGDAHLAPEEPTLALDVTDLLHELWLRRLAGIGVARGVVSRACFEGLREHGYVAGVDR